MSLFGWLRGKTRNPVDPRRETWHQEWSAACGSPSRERAAELTAALAALGLPEDDIEIEREMLAGIEHLADVRSSLPDGQLPTVETGHHVVGTDRCHFSAPASMPDEATQPSGRLILTHVRAIFAGGGKATTIPWHAVADVLRQQRDLILIRRDRETAYRFRCNAFGDALEAAWLAQTLAEGQRRQRGV